MKVQIEFIDEVFCKLRYDDVEITLMRENEYINATELCSNNGKNFLEWLNKESSIELITELDKFNRSCNDFYDHRGIVLNVLVNNTSVYYVHRDLILNISHWISPLILLKVGKILNSYVQDSFSLEYEFLYSGLMEKLEEIITLNESTIDLTR
ncbi:KilA N domain protein [Finch poxvirus]|uniref:KilA N domain protein n=2 Tax=unclassified Avipoxvirus TaxID=336487 RepID=A0AAT9UQN7_9POXV|nr:KilA N domain protein [Finch poxvirus]UOX39146.1 KilA N domain protein [Finch poxvirus]